MVLGDQLQQARLGFRLGVGRDRDVDEREAGRLGHGPEVLVVGDHDGDLRTQAAGPPAEDEVVQAVAELRHHDQQSLRAAVVEAEVHVEFVGNGARTPR